MISLVFCSPPSSVSRTDISAAHLRHRMIFHRSSWDRILSSERCSSLRTKSERTTASVYHGSCNELLRTGRSVTRFGYNDPRRAQSHSEHLNTTEVNKTSCHSAEAFFLLRNIRSDPIDNERVFLSLIEVGKNNDEKRRKKPFDFSSRQQSTRNNSIDSVLLLFQIQSNRRKKHGL